MLLFRCVSTLRDGKIQISHSLITQHRILTNTLQKRMMVRANIILSFQNHRQPNNSINPIIPISYPSPSPFSFKQTLIYSQITHYSFIHSRNIGLTLVKIHDLLCRRRFFRLFVFSNPHKSRESQRYSLIRIHQSNGSRMNRRNG